MRDNTHLFLLHVEIVDDDTNEEVQCEEGTKDDEEDKVEVHADSVLCYGLLVSLSGGSERVSVFESVTRGLPVY